MDQEAPSKRRTRPTLTQLVQYGLGCIVLGFVLEMPFAFIRGFDKIEVVALFGSIRAIIVFVTFTIALAFIDPESSRKKKLYSIALIGIPLAFVDLFAFYEISKVAFFSDSLGTSLPENVGLFAAFYLANWSKLD